MDLKLGKRVWDDQASQDKIDREMKKYPIQETVGFRIIGLRVCMSLYGAVCSMYMYVCLYTEQSVVCICTYVFIWSSL